MNKNLKTIFALIFILFGAILVSFQGSVLEKYDEQIFWLLRLPRTISAVAIGGGLAVSGAVLQCIFQNPLADPFTIGISSAAVLGAIIGSLFKINPLLGSTLLSFIFSITTLFGLSLWMKKRSRYITEVLLIGIILGFFFSAVATLLLALTDPATWTSALTWIYGSLGKLSLSEAVLAFLVICLLTLLIWIHSKHLDMIAVGDLSAESVGVKPETIRFRMFLLVATSIAVCVATSGIIGFIGLIIPHVLRKFGFHAHQYLIPAAFILGGSVLTFADFFAKTVASPSELPVGVVLAVFGAPFLFFLTKRT